MAADVPVVSSQSDVGDHGDLTPVVHVEGTYEQLDVRMLQTDPDTLFVGHAGIVLDDGTPVFLYPPQDDESLRSAEEIARFEHRRVRATGFLLSRNPRPGAAMIAPVLVDVTSIERADEV